MPVRAPDAVTSTTVESSAARIEAELPAIAGSEHDIDTLVDGRLHQVVERMPKDQHGVAAGVLSVSDMPVFRVIADWPFRRAIIDTPRVHQDPGFICTILLPAL